MLADSRRKTWSVAAAVLAVLGGLAIALTFGLADSGASDPKPFRDAANARITGSDEAAATVNGRIIPMSKFEANAILRSSWLGGSLEAPGNSELLQIAIDNEILYQEAERLGLVPSDKEVVAEARMVKEMLLAGMKEDTEGAELFREMQRQLEGTPYHVDVYDTSPEMLDAIRRRIATNAVREIALDDVSESVRNDLDKREAVVSAFVESLGAEVEVFAAFTN